MLGGVQMVRLGALVVVELFTDVESEKVRGRVFWSPEQQQQTACILALPALPDPDT